MPLLIAAVSLAMATLDLVGALIAFAGANRPTVGDLALSGLLFFLSVFTLRLGIPPLRRREKTHAPPRGMCWVALLVGTAAAVLAGAELVYGVVHDGVAAFLDFPVVLVIALGLSCSAVAILGIRAQPA